MLSIAGGIIIAAIILCNLEAIVAFFAGVAVLVVAVSAGIAVIYGFFRLLGGLGIPDQVLIDIMAVTVVGGIISYLLFSFFHALYRVAVRRHERKVTVSLVRSTARQQPPAQRL